ncbi:MAG: DUF58 domain-containing protein [Lentisphaerae bacterium]|nr:DUF58 domain-containing protein [Lentisphaerota bacterium]
MLPLRPTARGWVVALAGVAWLLVAIVNRMVFPFIMGCAALALVAASLVSSVVSLWGIRLRREPCGDAACGEAVSLPLTIENRRPRRRQPLVILETIPFAGELNLRTVVPPLSAREQRLVPRRVLALQRGEFRLSRLSLRGGDPAGLFCRERRLDLPAAMLVYPGTEPVPDLLLQQSESLGAVAASPVSAAGMSQDFYGVREYHPMDGLRYIHWKSTARSGRLMVREFERNAVMSVAILVDAHEHFVSSHGQTSNLEYQIRAAASICRHCAGLYCSLAFAAAGAGSSMVRPALASDAHDDIMVHLATLKPGPQALAPAAYELVRTLPRQTVVFCFSLAAPRDLAEALQVFVEQGMQVRWYCARRDVFDSARGRRSRSPSAAARQAGDLVPAELAPGMGLDKALVWTGS